MDGTIICYDKVMQGHQVKEYYSSPLPYTYLRAEELPEEFHWGNVNGVSYLTHSLNQHIPQVGFWRKSSGHHSLRMLVVIISLMGFVISPSRTNFDCIICAFPHTPSHIWSLATFAIRGCCLLDCCCCRFLFLFFNSRVVLWIMLGAWGTQCVGRSN